VHGGNAAALDERRLAATMPREEALARPRYRVGQAGSISGARAGGANLMVR
jgi:hypothetical protein